MQVWLSLAKSGCRRRTGRRRPVGGSRAGSKTVAAVVVVGWFGRLASPWSVNSQIKISPDKRPLFRPTVPPTGHSKWPSFPRFPRLALSVWVFELEIFHWHSTKRGTWKGLRFLEGKLGSTRRGRRWRRMPCPAPIAASFSGGLLMMNARDGSEMVRNVKRQCLAKKKKKIRNEQERSWSQEI